MIEQSMMVNPLDSQWLIEFGGISTVSVRL